MKTNRHDIKNKFVLVYSYNIISILTNHHTSPSATKYKYFLFSVYFQVLVSSKTIFMILWKFLHGGLPLILKIFCFDCLTLHIGKLTVK